MPVFARDGIAFRYLDRGAGLPFVFQHGLGGDVQQPAGLFPPPAGVRLLAFDCRAHGDTWPVGSADGLDFDHFGDDLLALLDRLGLPRAVVGGISMGAGVALNVAVRHPGRVGGLVLSRPAWLDGPMPAANVATYALIARLVRQYGPAAGKERFLASDRYRAVAAVSPDAAKSLAGQFDGEQLRDRIARLERLPLARPLAALHAAAAITVPTLVLAHGQDPVHPREYGRILARTIPGAAFVELTPKSVSKERHEAEVRDALAAFLRTCGCA